MSKPGEIYDLAVIGGGIAGAGIARDAALRGLSVALFEKDSFGSGTSSKSSKLIHGGLRYLETAWGALSRGRLGEAWKNFRFVFVSLRESRRLEAIAPELVRPLELVLPVYRGGARGLFTVFAGATLYWLLGVFSGGARIPRYLFGAAAVRKLLPGLKEDGLAGGVVVWDRVTDDRALVVETARSAERHGATLFERAAVEGWRREESGTYEIRVAARGGNESFRARKIVDASGPWVDKLRGKAAPRPDAGEELLVPVAGSHLTLKKFIPHSAILQAPDGRIFFVINLGDRARVGTTERPHRDPDTVEPTKEEIDYLLEALNGYFPDLKAGKKDVLAADAGLRPLARPARDAALGEISREHELHVDSDGVIHVLGVKLTDHRRAAELILDMLVPQFRRLGRPVAARSSTHKTPLKA
ncbi:MAG TPA: FAD-dependent oxidoreductase [Candidatus Eisenbacteria bacterium]|nr:FAD-dependent oxidoreductase [Candidatus Eisenbacteria bacterium]